MDRRTFIKGTAATSVAVAGLSEFSDPVTAQTGSRLQYLGQTAPAAVYEYDSENWSQVGSNLTSENGSVTKLAQYDGDLFVGLTTDTPLDEGAGQVYRLEDESWTLVGDGLDNNVCTLDVFDGDLYAGTAFGSANLYRYEGENEWNRIVNRTDWAGISAAYVWEEKLFVGDSRYDKYGYFDGESLTVEQPEAVGSCVYDFVDYEGELYGGNFNGVLRARGEEGSWATVDEADGGGLLELETFDGDMYAGAEGGTLYRWRSADEGLVNEYEFEDSIVALLSGGDALYIGIGHNAAEFDDSFPREAPAYLYRYRDRIATRITDVEFGNGVQDLRLTEYSLSNLRFVQWVENTRVVDDSTDPDSILHREPDPDLVAGSNVSVILSVEPPVGGVPDVSDLPDPVRIEVTRRYSGSRGTQSEVYSMAADSFQTMLDLDGVKFFGVVHDTWPVFELTDDLESVTIELAPNDSRIVAQPAMVSPPNQLRTTPPLRVGFIPVADGLFGGNYGSETEIQLDPARITGGFPLNYQSTVDEAIEYLERMFPTSEVRAYRHDRAIRGTTTAGKDGSDASAAHTELQKLVSGSSQISQGETVNGRGPISEFDETIGIVPTREPGGNNTCYFDFHNECKRDSDGDIEKCTVGVKFGNPSASLVMEAGEITSYWTLDEEDAAETNAHELGHHFMSNPYQGPAGDPMAQRDDTDSDPQPDTEDLAHARHEDSLDWNDPPGVKLQGFDLADGAYSNTGSNSIMSYARFRKWPDSRMIQLLIDGQFDADYQASSNYVGSLVAGLADVTEDGITFRRFTDSSGYAMPADDSGEVTLSVIDADGETVDSITTTTDLVGIPDGQEDDFSQDRPPENRIVKEDTVLFALPFPEEAVAVEATYAGSTTRVVPHSRLLAEAIRTVPDAGFVRNPDELRGALLKEVDSFESQLVDNAYTGALQRLRNAIEERVRDWIRDDYGAFANQYTRTELLELIDDIASRLEGLLQSGNGR